MRVYGWTSRTQRLLLLYKASTTKYTTEALVHKSYIFKLDRRMLYVVARFKIPKRSPSGLNYSRMFFNNGFFFYLCSKINSLLLLKFISLFVCE